MRLPRPYPFLGRMHFTEEQWNRYRAGYRAARWVARAEEGVLRLHFAVSGHQAFAVRVAPEGSGQRAVAAEVEAHPAYYNGAHRSGTLLSNILELEGTIQTRGSEPSGPW